MSLPWWLFLSAQTDAFSAVILAGGMPAGSVLFVAYLARYEATATSVISPSLVSLTTRGSTWAPHVMSHPPGLAGWLTVANQAVDATWRISPASTSAVIAGCGWGVRSGRAGS